MSRPSKAVTQAKKVAPPAVPSDFRHSGSSFGSAGYASSEDGCYGLLNATVPGGTNSANVIAMQNLGNTSLGSTGNHSSNNANNGSGDDGSYGMPAGKSPGPMFTHPGFSFPPMVGKYAHAEDQGNFFFLL